MLDKKNYRNSHLVVCCGLLDFFHRVLFIVHNDYSMYGSREMPILALVLIQAPLFGVIKRYFIIGFAIDLFDRLN